MCGAEIFLRIDTAAGQTAAGGPEAAGESCCTGLRLFAALSSVGQEVTGERLHNSSLSTSSFGSPSST